MNFDMQAVIHFVTTNPYALFVIIGFLVGLASRIIMPGPDPMGIVMTTLLGIAGSFVGGYGAQYAGILVSGTWAQFAASLLGSLALLMIYKFIRNV